MMLGRVILESKLIKGVAILITALSGWSIGRMFNSTILVEGASMEPALHSGQVLVCSRAVPALIPRGTIVVVSMFPEPPCIKRVIGLPNETVSFDRGEVFVDGTMLREPYIPEQTTTYSWGQKGLSAGNDGYVLLGDNRVASMDSRDYGVVLRSRIIAVLDLPPAPAKLLPEPRYRIQIHHAELSKSRGGQPPRGHAGSG